MSLADNLLTCIKKWQVSEGLLQALLQNFWNSENVFIKMFNTAVLDAFKKLFSTAQNECEQTFSCTVYFPDYISSCDYTRIFHYAIYVDFQTVNIIWAEAWETVYTALKRKIIRQEVIEWWYLNAYSTQLSKFYKTFLVIEPKLEHYPAHEKKTIILQFSKENSCRVAFLSLFTAMWTSVTSPKVAAQDIATDKAASHIFIVLFC